MLGSAPALTTVPMASAMAMKLPVIVERNAWTLPQERYNATFLADNPARYLRGGTSSRKRPDRGRLTGQIIARRLSGSVFDPFGSGCSALLPLTANRRIVILANYGLGPAEESGEKYLTSSTGPGGRRATH